MRQFAFVFLLSCVVTSIQAQQLVELDKIVAEVEDNIILDSDIKNSISDLKRQGAKVPSNPECIILEQLIVGKLMAAQAKRDSLVVTPQEVERDIELRIRNFIQAYGSLENLEKVSGRTIFQIKQDFKDAIRDNKLAESMQRKIVDNIKVTPSEVKQYFNTISQDSLPYYESEITVGVLTIYPKPSPDLDAYLKSELQQYRNQLRRGQVSFDFLVKTYSQDPSKTQNQGVYQVNVSDKFWDPNFLAACFRLENEEISPPVKSKFGYHLIKMIERRGTSATVQHLLRMSQPSEVEIEEVTTQLQDLRKQIADSTVTFQSAVAKYSEDDYAKFSGGFITSYDGSILINYDQLEPDLVKIVKDLKVGEISEPVEFKTPQGILGYRIVHLVHQTTPHREQLEYDYKKINDRVVIGKKKQVLDTWIKHNIHNTNWRVIDKYNTCPSIAKWSNP